MLLTDLMLWDLLDAFGYCKSKKEKDGKSGIKVQVCFANYHQSAKKHLSLFSQILRGLTSRRRHQ
jgi:hypothetical protein